jgi:protein-arginine kinase activator protein McsA
VERDDRMRALNEDLQKAVAEENYESAAALRDQIRQLEHERTVQL